MQSFKSVRRHSIAAALFATLFAAVPALAVGQFDIHLNPGPNLTANPEALAAFQRAADEWKTYISSPIRININAEIQPNSNPFVIGSTNVYTGQNLNLDYTTVRDAMAARSVRPGNEILASLPTSLQLQANVPATGSFDNTTVGIATANQKALGLLPAGESNTSLDGLMVFNSNFAFDYDRSDGIESRHMDFETVATHEIGHVLGFISDTDDYDFDPTLNDNATTLDLFRFNAASIPATAIEFTNTPRELRPGQTAFFADLQNAFPMSTGAAHGDGNQASHWRDDFYLDPATGNLILGSLIGIMDPTLSYGVTEYIGGADVRAMELIGYDTVPEPSSLALVIIAMIPLAKRSRR